MKIYSIDDYDYLVRNGCCPDGYVEGLGIVISQTVTVKSTSPDYPNDRTLGIDRRTQFMSILQVPVIVPLIPVKSSKDLHEEVRAMIQKTIDENTAMPAFSSDLRAMVFRLKKEIEKKRSGNNEKIRKAKIKLEQDPYNRRAQNKIRKAEEENARLSEVEREIRTLAVSNQQYDLITNYSFPKTGTDMEYRGGFDYNPVTKHAEIRVGGSKPTLGTFAHELKHAYQFETGTLSGYTHKGRDGDFKYFLYDKEDEREAFARGQLFGLSETFDRNASVYDRVPDSRNFGKTDYTKHTWKASQLQHSAYVISHEVLHEYELTLRNPNATQEQKAKIENELLNLSSKSNCAFRINGKTYYTPPKR